MKNTAKGKKILLVSAGMLSPKKKGNPLWEKHLYLNFGLLGLASILEKRGYETQLFHGNCMGPNQLILDLARDGLLNGRYPMFLSIPSSFALDWAREFCSLLKKSNPDVKIIVGGRWVIGTDGSWIRKKIPDIDLVVYGTAENRVKSLLNPKKWTDVPYTDLSTNLSPENMPSRLPILDYKIVDNCIEYQPSIEISRGCGMGCFFCVENNTPPSFVRSPSEVVQSIREYQRLCDNKTFSPYFEASCFRPSHDWVMDFSTLYRKYGFSISWRCETRADTLSIDAINTLAKAGLKVIDFGLESGSHRQILRMKKAQDPKAYLRKASSVLKQCKALGIWAKINLLLYAGEDFDTIEETVNWLEPHKDCIKGVSVGPFIIYRDAVSARNIELMRSLGGSIVDESSLENKGYAELNLSKTIDFNTARELSIKLSKYFMSKRDYFDLKSFTYFPRSFTYDDFLNILKGADPESLPFEN